MLHKLSQRFLKQGFTTLLLFNTFNIAYSAGLHWRYASEGMDGYAFSSFVMYVSLGVLAVWVVVGGMGGVAMGEFVGKFKDNFVCRLYVSLSIVYRVALGLYSSLSI